MKLVKRLLPRQEYYFLSDWDIPINTSPPWVSENSLLLLQCININMKITACIVKLQRFLQLVLGLGHLVSQINLRVIWSLYFCVLQKSRTCIWIDWFREDRIKNILWMYIPTWPELKKLFKRSVKRKNVSEILSL
jgi:hypothetical protein